MSNSELLACRFFIDHGMIHDRVSGKHVSTEAIEYAEGQFDTSPVTNTLDLLNSLSATRTQLDELRAENERLKSLVERAYKEGHNCGRADPVVYQSADQDWQQSRARKALGGTNV